MTPTPYPPHPCHNVYKGMEQLSDVHLGETLSRNKHHICVLVVLLESIIYTKILQQEYKKKR